MEERDWADYRKTENGLTWRVATLADVPAILELWKISERVLHATQDKPFLFARPVLLTLVAEREDGSIADAFYVEAEVSVTKIGVSREGFEGCDAVVEDVRRWLVGRGFRVARITVPKLISAAMGETLKRFGFRHTCSKFAHWVRRL